MEDRQAVPSGARTAQQVISHTPGFLTFFYLRNLE